DELRFELILASRGVVRQRNDPADLAVSEVDHAGFLIEVRIGTRKDFDGVRLQQEIPGRIAARFGVAAAPEFRSNLPRRDPVTYGHGLRRGKQFRRVSERSRTELGINQPGIPGVEKRKRRKAEDRDQQQGKNQNTSERLEE